MFVTVWVGLVLRHILLSLVLVQNLPLVFRSSKTQLVINYNYFLILRHMFLSIFFAITFNEAALNIRCYKECLSVDDAEPSSGERRTQPVCASCQGRGSARSVANAISTGLRAATWSTPPSATGRQRAEVSFQFM